MREIIFRGKRIYNGEWVEGSLIVTDDGPCILEHDQERWDYPYLDGKDGVIDGKIIVCNKGTIGQYTGLKDKNGKRIFEGDIVTFKTRTSSFKPCFVRLYEEEARFVVTMPDGVRSYPMDRSWDYEVIGNIHDNPELLDGR